MKEQIIKLKDGRRLKLVFNAYSSVQDLIWKYDLSVCQKGKRTFIDIINTDDYAWRCMNNLEKAKDKHIKRLELINDNDFGKYVDIYLNSIKPSIEDFT